MSHSPIKIRYQCESREKPGGGLGMAAKRKDGVLLQVWLTREDDKLLVDKSEVLGLAKADYVRLLLKSASLKIGSSNGD